MVIEFRERESGDELVFEGDTDEGVPRVGDVIGWSSQRWRVDTVRWDYSDERVYVTVTPDPSS